IVVEESTCQSDSFKKHSDSETLDADTVLYKGDASFHLVVGVQIIDDCTREQHKKLDFLEMELAAAKQEGFVSKQLLETNGTYSEGRPLVMIGILTIFGRQKNRDAIRNAWMGSAALKKLEDGKGIVARLVLIFKLMRKLQLKYKEEGIVSLKNLKTFTFRELQQATNSFNSKNILGAGGFGNVYRGKLGDGSMVAVKRLKDFRTELEIISLAVHRNLLRLIGYCATPNEKLLVYPYMSNDSVASRLRVFEIEDMNIKALIRFGRENCQKSRPVTILCRSKKH
ncbi:hypothetical protein S245_047879, partial [Arachis hypogaea]